MKYKIFTKCPECGRECIRYDLIEFSCCLDCFLKQAGLNKSYPQVNKKLKVAKFGAK